MVHVRTVINVLVIPRLFTVLPDMPFNPSSISSNFIFGPITDFEDSESTEIRLDPVSNKQIVFFPFILIQ